MDKCRYCCLSSHRFFVRFIFYVFMAFSIFEENMTFTRRVMFYCKSNYEYSITHRWNYCLPKGFQKKTVINFLVSNHSVHETWLFVSCYIYNYSHYNENMKTSIFFDKNDGITALWVVFSYCKYMHWVNHVHHKFDCLDMVRLRGDN